MHLFHLLRIRGRLSLPPPESIAGARKPLPTNPNFRLSAVPMDTVPARRNRFPTETTRRKKKKLNFVSNFLPLLCGPFFFLLSILPLLLVVVVAVVTVAELHFFFSVLRTVVLFFFTFFQQPTLLIPQPTEIETQIFSHSRTYPGGTKLNPDKKNSRTALWPRT